MVSVTPGHALPLEKDHGNRSIGGWVGFGTGLDTESRGKSFACAVDRILVIRAVVRHYTGCYPDHVLFIVMVI
jgi:hypothetical protein